MRSDFIGTVEGSGTIQPVLQRAMVLCNRYHGEQWHYSNGTIESSGTIQTAL